MLIGRIFIPVRSVLPFNGFMPIMLARSRTLWIRIHFFKKMQRGFTYFGTPNFTLEEVPREPFSFDPTEALDSFEGKDALNVYLKNLDQMDSLNELCALKDAFLTYNNHVNTYHKKQYREWEKRVHCWSLNIPLYNYFQATIGAIQSKLTEVTLKQIPGAVVLNANRVAYPNGLYFEWFNFVECVDEFCLSSNQPTPENFREYLDHNLCTDWNKMDMEGESFGGYWQYPEGTYEREHAYELCGKENKEALFALPYPYALIMWTIKFGCSSRLKSVKFSRTVCKWFHKMIYATGQLDTLERQIKYQLNCQHKTL